MKTGLLNEQPGNDDTLALPYIDQVAPGGHHFDTEHSLSLQHRLLPSAHQQSLAIWQLGRSPMFRRRWSRTFDQTSNLTAEAGD